MLDSVFSRAGELQYQTLSYSGLNDGLISLRRWIKVAQGILHGLYGATWGTTNLKHFAVCFIGVVYATFMVFCQQNRPRNGWGVWQRINIFGVRLRWFSLPLLPKYRYVQNHAVCCNCLGSFQLTTFKKLLQLLAC